MKMILWTILAIITILQEGSCHVSLTFPPARKYELDFLDTFRTPRPCGMPKGDIKTSLATGREIEIDWHLGYPHRGSIILELFDKNGNLVQTIEDNTSDDNADKFQQRATFTFDDECQDCYIRLQRQALEWGDNYRFQSCADVDIVDPQSYTEDCLGKGTVVNNNCQCNRGYSGDRCQWRDDCVDDSDCGGSDKGMCLDPHDDATSQPGKQCYCKSGFMGLNCQKDSALKDTDLNKFFDDNEAETIEKEYSLESNFAIDFYWRVVDDGDTLEGVLRAKNTLSWVALGFRPLDSEESCRSFPPGAGSYTAQGLHPMDCTDIILGTVREGNLARIGDYYTRDRSTPHHDEFFGGEDNLLGAVGREADGTTTIMFRRPMKKSGPADHAWSDSIHFIWAHGIEPDEFYAVDELKYHGGNRGHSVIHLDSDGMRGEAPPEPLSKERKMLIGAVVIVILVLIIQLIINVARDTKKM